MPAPGIEKLIGGHPGGDTAPSDVNKWGDNPPSDDAPVDVRPSQLKDMDRLFTILRGWFRADSTHLAVWLTDAKKAYDFRAGDQWEDEDKQILNAQSRPEIVFNRVLTILKAVAGMEINGRHEVHYIPRHNEDTAVNELLTGAGKYLTDECDAEDEESQAFDDANTCGLGWTEHRLDYELDSQGMYIEERIDPLEMRYDRNAKRKNLIDTRRIHRVRKIPLGDAITMFPGKTRSQLDAVWAVGTELDVTTKTLEEKRMREENTTDTTYDDNYEVTIVNTQWWERERYYLIADGTSNQMTQMTPEKRDLFLLRSRMIKSTGQDINHAEVEMTRRIYKEAYLGGEVLAIGDAALGQFKWTCITGELHRSKNNFFGLVKIMRDPQMWANKWLSQSLHILNSNAKGGIMAEQDAFEDVRDAEEKWARPDAIVWTKRGALSGDKPKIQARPGGQMPVGHVQLMEFAITALRDVTGINLELLGQQDQNQPGILEAQRKQAGMTVLATTFDALRRFRKMGGRIRLHIIQNYLSDGRLIRIVGKSGAQAVPLMKDHTAGDYNTIIDDAPTSPNQKEANWAVISQMIPAFKEQLAANPELLSLLMEYSPLPARVVQAFNDLLAQQAPKQQQTQGLAQAGATAKINKDQAQAELYLAQAGKQQSTAMYDVAIAMNEFMRAHNEKDLAAAKAAHERVKAMVAASTPITAPPNSAAEQFHERAMQSADNEHARKMQLGQQRFDLLKGAMDHVAKMKEMAAQTGMDHASDMQQLGAQHANDQRLAALQPAGTGVGNTEAS
jgi:hypothetical protein